VWLIQTWTILPCFRGQKTTAVVMELPDRNVPENRANHGELFRKFSIRRRRSKSCAIQGFSRADYQRGNVRPILWKCRNSGTNMSNSFWHGKVWGATGAGKKCPRSLITQQRAWHPTGYGDTPGRSFSANIVSKLSGIATRLCSMPVGNTSPLNHRHPGGDHRRHRHSHQWHHPNQ